MLSAQSLSLHLQKKTIHWSFSIISFLHKTHHITSWLRYHKKNSFSFNFKNFNSNCVCILSSSCGKKTAPPTAIKRHNWMPIGYCQTSYQYSPIYSAFQMLMLHEWLIIGCWLYGIIEYINYPLFIMFLCNMIIQIYIWKPWEIHSTLCINANC